MRRASPCAGGRAGAAAWVRRALTMCVYVRACVRACVCVRCGAFVGMGPAGVGGRAHRRQSGTGGEGGPLDGGVARGRGDGRAAPSRLRPGPAPARPGCRRRSVGPDPSTTRLGQSPSHPVLNSSGPSSTRPALLRWARHFRGPPSPSWDSARPSARSRPVRSGTLGPARVPGPGPSRHNQARPGTSGPPGPIG